LAELEGGIEVAPNDQGRIGSQVHDEVLADYAPVVGAAWRPTPWLALGATWRGASQADFDLPIEVDLGETFPLPVPTLQVRGTAQFDPEQATLEVAGRPLPPLQVAAGLTWKRWSDYQNPIVYTAVPADFPAQPAPDFTDIIEWRAGVEWPIEAGPLVVTSRRLSLHAHPGARADRPAQPARQRPPHDRRRRRPALRPPALRGRRPMASPRRAPAHERFDGHRRSRLRPRDPPGHADAAPRAT
ncbi:MAG: hypothetical protein KC620_18200, partial [Myxococcales bacterium]|nr:hypothetical protein [Myxococcales bacterium]